jgi:prepilin-type N-terminal cleavage/methylation domain-containing protein
MYRVKRGFTLIELLVVIAIIALLLSILMPSLNKVKKQARLVVCRTNLHQWAIAVQAYSAANDGKLLSSFGYQAPGSGTISSVYPCEFWLDAENLTGVSTNDHSNMFSQEAVRPYMPGFNEKGYSYLDVKSGNYNPESLQLKGAWRCPSNGSDTLDFTIGQILNGGFFRLQYSYYARVDLWRDSASNPEDIPNRQMASKHVLFTDTFYNFNEGNALIYNHGIYGYSDEYKVKDFEELQTTRGRGGDGLPSVSGINKAFGDGHVEWKERREFNIASDGSTLNKTMKGTDSNPFLQPHAKGVAGSANFY